MPYDSAISVLGIYLEKTIIQKGTCTPMFTAELFTIAIALCLAPDMKVCPENFKTRWFGP